MHKTLLFAGCALLLAACTSACAPMAGVTGAPANIGSLSGPDQVAALKEVNRHLETCDRTYAWPFAVTIHCSPVAGAPATTTTAPLTAADVEAIVAKAIAGIQK